MQIFTAQRYTFRNRGAKSAQNVTPETSWGAQNLLLLLLLSLDAHNHVDDYSGTLGGVRKVHISALVTSP